MDWLVFGNIIESLYYLIYIMLKNKKQALFVLHKNQYEYKFGLGKLLKDSNFETKSFKKLIKQLSGHPTFI